MVLTMKFPWYSHAFPWIFYGTEYYWPWIIHGVPWDTGQWIFHGKPMEYFWWGWILWRLERSVNQLQLLKFVCMKLFGEHSTNCYSTILFICPIYILNATLESDGTTCMLLYITSLCLAKMQCESSCTPGHVQQKHMIGLLSFPYTTPGALFRKSVLSDIIGIF